MKKILSLAILGIATMLVVSFKAEWSKYTTLDGHCSISFPGKAEESIDTARSADGVPFKIHLATYSPTDNDVYMLGWINMNDFYPSDKPMKQMLEESRDGATSSMGATDVKTLKINLENEPYIDFTFSGTDFVGRDRIYVINKFQYSVITLFSKQTTISPDADKFITSFRHLK